MQNNANLRKWCALISAILFYYIIHEGAHVLTALCFGAFEKVRLLGLGVQVVADVDSMSSFQVGVFCLAGSVATLLAAYLLLAAVKHIVQTPNKLLKAVGYYTTCALLLIDPLYLAFVYKFVGGGDMNGILLFGLPELVWQIIYGLLALLNLLLFIRYVYPAYKKAFA